MYKCIYIFRKLFGSTWIKKVKKAGTELMNKVNK
jgi:hypothetical protein